MLKFNRRNIIQKELFFHFEESKPTKHSYLFTFHFNK